MPRRSKRTATPTASGPLTPNLDLIGRAHMKMAINWSIIEEVQYRKTSLGLDGPMSIFVLDDPETHCRSAAAIKKTCPDAQVTMCSTDQELRRYHDPKNGLTALCDASTYVLEDLTAQPSPPTFDAIFLDYCATPSLHAHNWHNDVDLALKLRAHKSTPIYLTFSQRPLPYSAGFVHHSVATTFPDLVVSSVSQYFDTAPMAIFTVLPKTEAFTFPPLSTYLLPSPHDVVKMTTFGGWTGTVTRCVTSKCIEVRETGTNKVFSVPLKNITLFDPKSGRITPRPTGKKPAGKPNKKKRTGRDASDAVISAVAVVASPQTTATDLPVPKAPCIQPSAPVHPFVPAHPAQIGQPSLDPAALIKAAQMAAQAVLEATKVVERMTCIHPVQAVPVV